jgi:hydrogenase expression/formation protein HypE
MKELAQIFINTEKQMDRIKLGHGGGGEMTSNLIKNILFKHLKNDFLLEQTDGANLGFPAGELVVTCDGFVASPLFFKGGDIGKLAVCGTINDLAVMGATPKYLTLGLIIEEGLLISDLEKIIKSIAREVKKGNVLIVAGDTKVVEKGKGDGLYINMSGVGLKEGSGKFPKKINEGDVLVINGSIGDHSMAMITSRGEYNLNSSIKSDCQNLYPLINTLFEKCKDVKFLRDVTRGGLSAVLSEVNNSYGLGLEVWEKNIKIKKQVKTFCNMLGLDPLIMANEGKVLAILPENQIKFLPVDFFVIGKVTSGNKVVLKKINGSKRLIDCPSGELLPRIC